MGEDRNVTAKLRCFSLYRYDTILGTILPYPVLPCEVPVQIMANVLAAGRQFAYRKFYVFFVCVTNLKNLYSNLG